MEHLYHAYLQGSEIIIEGFGVRQESEEVDICSQTVFAEHSCMVANSQLVRLNA